MSEKSIINMPLRKVHALEILRGKKKREFRAFTDYWVKRLAVCDDTNDKNLVTSTKEIDSIHFYPYNNKWFLNCKVEAIDICKVDDDFIKYFGEEVEAEKDSDIFVITLGDVIDTNLDY